MLQQTQVETVIPYFKHWIKEYPSLSSVIPATQDQLLKLWEGLGYYERCRNFYTAVQQVVTEHNGIVPSKKDVFSQLPGVGPYISAAVLSIAYGKQYPALDGNVKRVISRLLQKKQDSAYNQKVIKNFIKRLMENVYPGDVNQALMDLGRLVCRPNQARCLDCPLIEHCGGYASGFPESYPHRRLKKTVHQYKVVAGLLWHDETFLIMQRQNKNHLYGLWEFPGGKIKKNESKETALHREMLEECGIKIAIGAEVGSIKHAYSHFRIQLTLFHCYPKNGSVLTTTQPYQWITPRDVEQYPFPKANHKLFTLLNNQGWRN